MNFYAVNFMDNDSHISHRTEPFLFKAELSRNVQPQIYQGVASYEGLFSAHGMKEIKNEGVPLIII